MFQNDLELHKKLGIDSEKAKSFDLGKGRLTNHGKMDPRDYSWLNGDAWTAVVYGDTDSCDSLSRVYINDEEDTIENWYKKLYNKNNLVQNEPDKETLITNNVSTLTYDEKTDKIVSRSVKYIMRHKVSKAKWKLKTKSGKEVIVTGDHSLMVIRDNKLISVKAKDVNIKTDKILSIK